MLTLSMPLILLIIMTMYKHKSWYISMISLIFLTFLSMLYMSNDTMSITSISMMDTMSSSLITLSIFITALMMLASTKYALSSSSQSYSFLMLTLLLILIWCFSSSLLFPFYIWFEASLIPTMFIILKYGYQPERLQASMYLMLYTIIASLPMLITFILVYYQSKHQCLSMYNNFFMPSCMGTSPMYWMPLIMGFLVKLPMFSVHLWLPKAHVQAPIAGSMILAAILLKLGGYGLSRMITMFYKSALYNSSPLLMSISLCGAMYTSFICIRQPDLKSLIAYSSVGHMGIMLAGMSTLTKWGMYGALMMMIAHGLCSSALFCMANITYEITHTRSMYISKGMLCLAPIISMWWFLFTAANMAAPPSINLLSEIMLMTSILSSSSISMILLGLISFLTATYSLILYTSTQHGFPSTHTRPLQTILLPKDMTLLSLHFLPLLLLILKPEIISMWL